MMNFQTMQPLKFSALLFWRANASDKYAKHSPKQPDLIGLEWSEVKFQAVHQINICWQTCVGCTGCMEIGQDRYHRHFHRLEWFICIDFCSGVSRCSTSFARVSVHPIWNRARVSANGARARERERVAVPPGDSSRTKLERAKTILAILSIWKFHHRFRFRVACLHLCHFSTLTAHTHTFHGISFPLGRNNQNEILPEYIRT